MNHATSEYSRDGVHVSICESFFGLLKRGIVGTFHRIRKEHTHRYCDEFAFRWDNRKTKDSVRRDVALKQVEGKRLMFKQPNPNPSDAC